MLPAFRRLRVGRITLGRMELRRPALIGLGVGVVSLALGLLLATTVQLAMMPSYLAAWLFWAALPFGALPLIMALELNGGRWAGAIGQSLRRLLAAAPLLALLAVPILLTMRRIYPWATGAPAIRGLFGHWLTPGPFAIRSVVYLAVWVLLAVLFCSPATAARLGRRRRRAVAGLLIYLPLGTLAAIDWAMSIEPDLNSSEYGLLFIAAQCGIALTAAIILVGDSELLRAGSSQTATLLLTLVGLWMFLHFTQFLTVWSADAPREVAWYLRRDAGGGRAAEWFAVIAGFAVPVLLLLSPRARRSAGLVSLIAGLVFLAHLIEMLWLITPTFRSRFTVSLADVLALLGIGGLTLGCLLAAPPPRGHVSGQIAHG